MNMVGIAAVDFVYWDVSMPIMGYRDDCLIYLEVEFIGFLGELGSWQRKESSGT